MAPDASKHLDWPATSGANRTPPNAHRACGASGLGATRRDIPVSIESGQTQFSRLRRPLLIQRAILTVVVSGMVCLLPLGPNRFYLAATIVLSQVVSTVIIERLGLELIDQLGAFLLVEHFIVLAAGLICPPSYVAASMVAIASVGINAPYLTLRWLRRITPVTVLATIIPALVHDIDGAIPIICISTLLSLHMTFNRSGAVLLAADAAERAQHQADHDPLTGLANRRVLVTRLDELERTTEMGLLLVDLNDFKQINDNYGHDIGDIVLRSVAATLAQSDDSVLALRLGGDEFAVMVPGAAHETERVADVVLEGLTIPIRLAEAELEMGASIGMSHSSTAAPHELLRFADLAMFEAKRAGGGRSWYSRRAITDNLPRGRHDRRGRWLDSTQP